MFLVVFFRIRSKLMKLLHDFYEFEGFLHLDPNVITIEMNVKEVEFSNYRT